ncbi:hypothetical protein HWV62_33057 [Athelia sp. TMB]|nr:hypothetical protein HWV62_33057 [Athelia sp. TMB]
MLSLSQLLNPEPLQSFEQPALPSVLPNTHVPSTSTFPGSIASSRSPSPQDASLVAGMDAPGVLSVQENVFLNRKTTLARLYTYARGVNVEYPTTDTGRPIGHLFEIDPNNWFNPRLSFAYSQGEPCGNQTSRNGGDIFCALLVDKDGQRVPCKISQYTCQGSKVCPYADMKSMCTPHVTATRAALKTRLRESQQLQNVSRAEQALLSKTLTLYRSYRILGCLGPASCSALPTTAPDEDEDEWLARLRKIRRGHDPKLTCDGKLVFDHDEAGQAFVRCEYFKSRTGGTRDHLFTYNPGCGLYHTEYLEALFDEDIEAINKFEVAAKEDGYGPLAPCTHVTNHSSIRVNCPCEHRTPDGRLDLGEMVYLRCDSTFRCFEPLEEYREACPRILVICRNEHAHPLPLPTKTPPSVRLEVFELLRSVGLDLPDITARRFLRHPVTHAHLQKRLPNIQNPCLADLHISLANREHIKNYISQVQKERFPFGTGWNGLLHLKSVQDRTIPSSETYIRFAAEIPINSLPVHDEDELEPPNPTDTMLRIISDIAFKRVSGFLEFEIAIPYCRVYLNRQSAAAHAIVFQKIEEIVMEDTGESLKWRHLHANSLDEHVGILQWAGDQHGGQAKGLGLHLQSLAQKLPGRPDLHQPERMLASLTEYEHLLRIFRLCSVHVDRNIDASPVPEAVKQKMRSLICVTHPDFEGTLRAIAREGGKKGADWVEDKRRAKFALPGICWERSHIPKIIWQVGDATTNTLEALHADVNLEGKFCSLLGGLKKGQHFDNMKLRSLHVFDTTGIRPSYQMGHISYNIARGLKRSMVARGKAIAAEDNHITAANKRLKRTHDDVLKAKTQLSFVLSQSEGRRHDTRYAQEVARAEKRKGAAEASYTKALASSVGARGTGTGRVSLLLPSAVGDGMSSR